MSLTRRNLLTGLSLAGAGALLVSCHRPASGPSSATNNEGEKSEEIAPTDDQAQEPDVTATEDLMREHGILRRALLVYRESAVKLRDSPSSVPPAELEKTAQLFRAFGEDYHEKKLEEAYIFPTVKKVQGTAALYTDVLLAQHVRGREITDYILAATNGDRINNVTAFVSALESFVRMYEHHAALEDTLIFPAWKSLLRPNELDEMSARFEDIEQDQFGDDGFAAALKRISQIEETLGLANLGMFTAPPPPPAHS